MRRVGWLLLTAVLAAPAHGQTKSGQTASALSCGALKVEAGKTASTSQWTIFGPSENTTETGVLRSGPRFECLADAILIVEFTSQTGRSFFAAYFPDGTNVGYGRQQIDRRGGRFVLPVQAKKRIAPPYRAAFDYHCRFDMPADPIHPATRPDCVF